MSAAARALDAADGVIDGRYYGRPIVQGNASPVYASQYSTAVPVATSYPVTRQVIGGGQVFGGQVIGGSYGGGNSALALDAADGVIDGKFFGRQIVQGGPQVISGGQIISGGQYYGGQQVISGGQYFGGQQVIRSVVPTTTYGGGQSALALDAADGVIDGKFFGRQIVQGGPQVISGGPQIISGGQYYGGQQVISGGYPTQVIRSVVPTTTYGGGQSALALDAADGVIDGKFFGRQIVQGGPQVISGGPQIISSGQYYGGQQVISGGYPTTQIIRTVGQQQVGNSALALDAADGVIDGKFFGRQIVQQQPTRF